jgi:hypothetical protein
MQLFGPRIVSKNRQNHAHAQSALKAPKGSKAVLIIHVWCFMILFDVLAWKKVYSVKKSKQPYSWYKWKLGFDKFKIKPLSYLSGNYHCQETGSQPVHYIFYYPLMNKILRNIIKINAYLQFAYFLCISLFFTAVEHMYHTFTGIFLDYFFFIHIESK